MTRMPDAVEMDVVAGPGAEGARRATGGPGPVTTSRPPDPDPEVPATVQRRRFSAAYRLRILKAAGRLQEARRGGRAVASRGAVFVAADELAAAARGGSAARDAGAPSGADAAPRRPTGDTARGGDPPAPAEVAAGGDDHHAPKKSCRDPGDPPDTPRRRRDRLMRRPSRRRARPRRCVRASACPGRRSIAGGAPRSAPHHRGPGRRRRARWVRPNARRCSTCCTASGSSTSRPPKSMPRCSRSRPTSVPRARCIACLRERRAQARHPAYTAPELGDGPESGLVVGHHQTQGPDPVPLLLAVRHPRPLSRYAVGWMVARHENAHLAERLIAATCRKQGRPAPTHHSCGPRRAHAEQARRGRRSDIDASHSRPRVSNDNPFSEAQFRTVKYRPEFPDRFGSLAHARAVSRDLFAWYNDAHHHSGLSYLTPAAVHYGRAAGSSKGHHVQKRCQRPCGSIGRRNRPARMPQERRPSPLATPSMG